MRFLRIIGILVLGIAVTVWCFHRPGQSTTNTVRPSTSKAQPEWLRRASLDRSEDGRPLRPRDMTRLRILPQLVPFNRS